MRRSLARWSPTCRHSGRRYGDAMRLNLPSAMPLFVAAGLSVAAIITSWPEPLSTGWEWASLLAAGAGVLFSLPFWRAAQLEAIDEGKSGIGALFAVIFAGMLVAVTLLHLANAILPPGGSKEIVVAVSDKYVSRGRRGSRSYHVVTTPVPGDSGRTDHTVGGLFASSGSYNDYRIGGCMALRWRPGWWWPVVVRREAVPCVEARPVVAPPPAPSMAMPGPAWSLVDSKLAVAAGQLNLPAGGMQLEMTATIDASGAITGLVPAPNTDPQAFQAVAPVLMARPGTLANGPGERRLWLKLLPPPVVPRPDRISLQR